MNYQFGLDVRGAPVSQCGLAGTLPAQSRDMQFVPGHGQGFSENAPEMVLEARYNQDRPREPMNMGKLPLQDLLGGIDEGLMSEMQAKTPGVINALMTQRVSEGKWVTPDTESGGSVERAEYSSRKRATNSSSEATDGANEEQGGAKKVQRAEKNRLSAARSREKKRVHIDELRRRVKMLSAENAQLQVEQLQAFQAMIEREKILREQNQMLELKVSESKERLKCAQTKLRERGVQPDQGKRNTWSSGEWGQQRN